MSARKLSMQPRHPSILMADQRTEAAAARRFVSMYGGDVRYCAPWGKWLIWDGQRWHIDDICAIESLAKHTAAAIWEEVNPELVPAERTTATAMLQYARHMASANGMRNMLTLARSEPGIPILPSQLDTHPWLFNCTNGTVDLRTGHRQHHNRGDYLTKLCPHEYLTGAEGESPLWELAVDRVFGGNADLIGFFRRLCGMAMSGEVIDHILPIFWGCGSNGKSLIIETLLDAMGSDFATKATSDLLLAGKNTHPTEKADLFGKRLVVCVETDDGRRLAESTIKELTGGDTVKTRRMREDHWTFRPTHTLFLVTNHKPIVRGSDNGIWRRLRLLPFDQTFWDPCRGESGPPELKANPKLREVLRPELAGIVRWLVDACRDWQREGLGQPSEVTAATAEYRSAMDVLAAFLEECCILQAGFTVKASAVRARYDEWCKENGELPVGGLRCLGFCGQSNSLFCKEEEGPFHGSSQAGKAS